MALLEAVLRSAEALLCRLTAGVWQNQDVPAPPFCHTGPHIVRECEQQAADANMCFTQVLQWHFSCLLQILVLELLLRYNIFIKYLPTVFISNYDQGRSASP